MTGTAANDRRITGVSNAADVTPVSSDAVNINTIQRNYLSYAAGTFASGTYTVNLTPAITAYWEGMIVTFKASAVNTGATNINVNGQGDVAITKAGGAALAAGDIQANQIVTVIYNSTGPRFEIIGSLGIDSWKLRGNANTNVANDFVGTTDAQPLAFRTNSAERMRILANGQTVVNNTTAIAGDIFSSYAGAGQYAVNGYATTGAGVYGEATGSNGFGVYGFNSNASGTGIIAGGNNVPSSYYLSDGTGGSFTGNPYGIAAWKYGGLQNGTGAGYFMANTTLPNAGVAVAYRTGGTNYKIIDIGAFGGNVSTDVWDIDNKTRRIMFAPEAPEIFFQDFGRGELVNGRAHVTLDPIFSRNIVVNEKHPLNVFIQLEGDCNGVYVSNKTATGFDVIELNNGRSNVKFTYFVNANRADYIHPETNELISKHEGVRFPIAPEPLPFKQIEAKQISKEAFKK